MLRLIALGFISARRFVAPLMLIAMWSFLTSELISIKNDPPLMVLAISIISQWVIISYVALLFAAAQKENDCNESASTRLICWSLSMLACTSPLMVCIGISILSINILMFDLIFFLIGIICLALLLTPALSAVYGYRPHTAIAKSVRVMTEDLRRPMAILTVLFLMAVIEALIQSFVSWPGIQPQQASQLFRAVVSTLFLLPSICIAGILTIQNSNAKDINLQVTNLPRKFIIVSTIIGSGLLAFGANYFLRALASHYLPTMGKLWLHPTPDLPVFIPKTAIELLIFLISGILAGLVARRTTHSYVAGGAAGYAYCLFILHIGHGLKPLSWPDRYIAAIILYIMVGIIGASVAELVANLERKRLDKH